MFLKQLVFFLIVKLIEVNCHGRLLVPPSRSSAWREDPIRFPVNYDDVAMFCGGIDKLWRVNKGKCGICGEDYGAPKQYEKGGAMYRGFVVRKYEQGQQIEVVVDITANHYGYFEFRICKVDKSKGDATQKCLDKHLLKDNNGQTKIVIQRGFVGKITTLLNLPPKLFCDHCVFQWKYNAGNSWNTDPITGQSCVGCGPQEQFFGCSDISISQRLKQYKKYFEPFQRPRAVKSESMEEFSQQKEQDNSVTVSKNLLKKLYIELKRLRAQESSSSLNTDSDSKNKLDLRENKDDDYGSDNDDSEPDSQIETHKESSHDSPSSNESDYDNSEREARGNSNNQFDFRENKSLEKPMQNSYALNLFKEKYNIG